jgi:hypothetical protein
MPDLPRPEEPWRLYQGEAMIELTFEEFCALPMEYRTGIVFDTGAQRLYRNDKFGLQREVFTKRNPRTGKWGKGKVYFFLDNDERQFDAVDQVYVAYMERACA